LKGYSIFAKVDQKNKQQMPNVVQKAYDNINNANQEKPLGFGDNYMQGKKLFLQ